MLQTYPALRNYNHDTLAYKLQVGGQRNKWMLQCAWHSTTCM